MVRLALLVRMVQLVLQVCKVFKVGQVLPGFRDIKVGRVILVPQAQLVDLKENMVPQVFKVIKVGKV
jgi:hypothetical protein